MENKNYCVKNQPLLYITQPNFDVKEGDMQRVFVWKEKELEQVPPEKQEILNENNDTTEEDNKEKAFNFNKLSLDEKIHFLTNMPEKVTKLNCLIKTKEKSYFGSLISNKEDNVTVQLAKTKEIISINKQDIDSLRLGGGQWEINENIE